MAKIPTNRRIISEDFDPEFQPMAESLGYILNDFMKNVTDAINGNLDYNNITQKIITMDITVDATGKPVGNNQINIGKSSILGLHIIKVINKTNVAITPTQVPYIVFTELGNNLIRIEKVLGLASGNKYSINILVY